MQYVSTFEARWKEAEALRGDVGAGAGEREAAGAMPGCAAGDSKGRLPRAGEAKSECERGIGAFLDYQVTGKHVTQHPTVYQTRLICFVNC